MKKVTIKRKPINRDAVTVADLEREILDLRTGLAEQTKTLANLRKDYTVVWEDRERINNKLHEMNADFIRAQQEVTEQQHFQSRAHETIERLVKIMAAGVIAHEEKIDRK